VPGGVYDRGGARTNVREAEIVARMIIDHYRAGRPESLGIIALSQAQQEAIRDALDALLARFPTDTVPEEGPDGLFIKNLENVQGDERDVILLSIGYARDASGILSHNFGPLNRQGGGRRLNVAITRARQQLVVVSSIRGPDIDLTRTKSEAVAQLREYLSFAEAGSQSPSLAMAGGGQFVTQLAQDIQKQLARRGYTVHAAVGCSDQRIDLAIVDPAQQDRYVLGIALDGPGYDAVPTARDRDRLRGLVLQGLGWTMHRLWAREGVRDADAELIRLYDHLHGLALAPAPTATPQVLCARCGRPLTTRTQFCGWCGAPVGVPVPPRSSSAATVSLGQPGPAGGARVITGSAAPTPQGAGSSTTTPTGSLAAGTVLNGRYRILSVLGTGAFGRVYRAEDQLDPQAPPLAIKELLDTQFSTPTEKTEAIKWFRREVSTLLSLSHPAIPTVHAYWTATQASGPFYLAMDFIAGKTLEQTLRDGGPVPWQEAVRWGIELCKAVAYLHSQVPPFVFRDLKAANIIIEAASRQPKLIDFGIARQFVVQSGQTAIGTWGYVPLEQVLGRTEPRSDIYALGATLHAMISGLQPDAEFARLQASGLDVPSTLQGMFAPLDTIVPGLPSTVAGIVAQATAYQAQDRFPDARALGIAMGQTLGLSAADAAAAMQQ
jgi:hypothetical protein